VTPDEHAETVARSIYNDPHARADYEAALIDVPAEVATVLDRLLAAERGRSRDWIAADSVTVLHADS
jgi:hypothetical protein